MGSSVAKNDQSEQSRTCKKCLETRYDSAVKFAVEELDSYKTPTDGDAMHCDIHQFAADTAIRELVKCLSFVYDKDTEDVLEDMVKLTTAKA